MVAHSHLTHVLRGGSIAESLDDEALFERVRAGDREAAAVFLKRHEDLFRRRIRRGMSRGLRRVCDSVDVFSTILRRMDEYIARGHLHIDTEAQFWGLVRQILSHSLADQGRLRRRLEGLDGEDAALGRSLADRVDADERRGLEATETIASVLEQLVDERDREQVLLWMNGATASYIATLWGTSPDAVRQRWRSLRTRIRDVLDRPADAEPVGRGG